MNITDLNKRETFTKETTAIFYNLKPKPLQQMLDFDFLSRREPSVSAIVHPGRKGFHRAFFGQREILIPIYDNIQEAAINHPQADVLINFASFRSAYDSSKEALNMDTIRTIIIVAEGMPENQAKNLIALVKEKEEEDKKYKDKNKEKQDKEIKRRLIIGPSTVGGIAAGKFRIGYAGGSNENIIRNKLYQPGSIGLVSKSSGMMNELLNIISKVSDGINESIAIGGDLFPGSTFVDHILRYQKKLEIKMIVALGELGGELEYELIKLKQNNLLTKPIIMLVAGTCSAIFPFEVQFGHAGAKAKTNKESAVEKNRALKEAGIIVPESFAEFEKVIGEEFARLKSAGEVPLKEEPETPVLPIDYSEAVRQGSVRKETNFTCTISSDAGEDICYNGKPLTKIIADGSNIGQTIGQLWFKKDLPEYFSKFIELCLIVTADHGPAVSGAHNAIVAARAGKDIISSLCSGLLTIGPKFGGALADSAKYFKEAVDKKLTSKQFVENMKQKQILIPGIGHRVKSKHNPDQRVKLLADFAVQNFHKLDEFASPKLKYLEFALEVEKITLQKADNLILNVDGCIAALFLDLLESSSLFNSQEIKEIIENESLNGLFALARSIGLIGHILDQKRIKAPLYRHPTEDILYLNEDEIINIL